MWLCGFPVVWLLFSHPIPLGIGSSLFQDCWILESRERQHKNRDRGKYTEARMYPIKDLARNGKCGIKTNGEHRQMELGINVLRLIFHHRR